MSFQVLFYHTFGSLILHVSFDFIKNGDCGEWNSSSRSKYAFNTDLIQHFVVLGWNNTADNNYDVP